MEDTWHNCENGSKKAASLSSKSDKNKFNELKNKVLYNVLGEEGLSAVFAKMRSLVSSAPPANDTAEVERWIDRIDEGRTSRTATHTTKFFSCSEKGATSRCEQMIVVIGVIEVFSGCRSSRFLFA